MACSPPQKPGIHNYLYTSIVRIMLEPLKSCCSYHETLYHHLPSQSGSNENWCISVGVQACRIAMRIGEPEDIVVKAEQGCSAAKPTQDGIAAKPEDADIAPPTKMVKVSHHPKGTDAIVAATSAASWSSAAKTANGNDEAASCSAAKPASSKEHHIPEVLQPLLAALNTTVGKYKEEAEVWDPCDVYDPEDTKAAERDKPRFLLKNVFDRYAAGSYAHGQPNQIDVVYKAIQGLVALFHYDMVCRPFDRTLSPTRQEEANSIYSSFCGGRISLTRSTPKKSLDLLAITWWQRKRSNDSDDQSFQNDKRYLSELKKLLQDNMRAPF